MKIPICMIFLASFTTTGSAIGMGLGQDLIKKGVNWLSKQTDPETYVIDPENNKLFDEVSNFIDTKDIDEILNTTTFEEKLFRVFKRECYASYQIMSQIKEKNTDKVVLACKSNEGNIHPLMMTLITKFLTKQGRTIHTALGEEAPMPQAIDPSVETLSEDLNICMEKSQSLSAAIQQKNMNEVARILKGNDAEKSVYPPRLLAHAKEYIKTIKVTVQDIHY